MFENKKMRELLFGSADQLTGGLPLRARINIPRKDGSNKTYYWEGNKGLLPTLLERVEELENKVKKIIK